MGLPPFRTVTEDPVHYKLALTWNRREVDAVVGKQALSKVDPEEQVCDKSRHITTWR